MHFRHQSPYIIMLSVVMPTDGREQPVVATLAALVPGAAAGLIREVLLVDRSNTETIARVADVAGCHFVRVQGSHLDALAAGARQAKSEWLMFLYSGAVLDHGWIDETSQFIQAGALSDQMQAGVFRYARSPYTRLSLPDVARECLRVLSGTSAKQGLLIARTHYEKIGGYSAQRSEAKFLAQLGRSRRITLRTRIFVPASQS
jgi:hypothetical protein